jgi:hypothetical protein
VAQRGSHSLPVAWAAGLVFLVSFALLFLGMDRTIVIYDEGIVLTNAMRVAAGELPHRDFYANYGPAQFYVLAWLFDLFGQRIMVERLFDLVLRAATLSLVYATLALHRGRAAAIVASVVCAIWFWSVGGHGYPLFPALLFMIAGSMALVHALTYAAPRYLVAAGLAAGVTALFRYEVGALVFIAHCLALIVHATTRHPKGKRCAPAWRSLLPYACAAAAVVLPLLFWYWLQGALTAFVHDAVLFPATYYARTRSLPFPPITGVESFLENITLYLPALVFAVAVWRFIGSRGLARDDIQKRELIFLAVFSMLLPFAYMKGVVRIGNLHLMLAIVPSLIVLAMLAGRHMTGRRTMTAVTWALATMACAAAVFAGWRQFELLRATTLSTAHAIAAGQTRPSTIQFVLAPERAVAIDFVRQHTRPGERIYAGLTRHDKIFGNDVFFYFAVNRLPATHWHHFDPGLQNRADIQAAMIRDLESTRPRYAMLESTWDDIAEPNESALRSGVTLLDDYLRSHYQQVREIGRISIWQRKDPP